MTSSANGQTAPVRKAMPPAMVPVRMATSGAFDQRVGRPATARAEMIGQDAVFERAEQRGNHAETGKRDKQEGHRATRIADDGEARRRTSRRISPLRDARLVVTIGQFVGRERRQEEISAMNTALAVVISASASRPRRTGSGTPARFFRNYR